MSAPALSELEGRLLRHAEPDTFGDAELDGLPEPVRRHLAAAIAPGTPLAVSVRSTKAVGKVTIELLSHHRLPTAKKTLEVGEQPVKLLPRASLGSLFERLDSSHGAQFRRASEAGGGVGGAEPRRARQGHR